jgi:hypothetical protein
MVGKANPDQLQFPLHPFGVTVKEFGGHGVRRLEEPGQWPDQSGCPIYAHDQIIRANWLAYQ